MKEILTQHLSELLTAIITALTTGLGSYLYGQKRVKEETKIVQADALSKMQEVYDKMVLDVDAQINRSKGSYNTLEAKVVELEKKLKEVEAFWKTKYNQLKKEFEQYKKQHS